MAHQWNDGPGQKRARIKNKAPVYKGTARGSQRAGGHKPPKKGCAVAAIALMGVGASMVTGAAWGAIELVRAVI